MNAVEIAELSAVRELVSPENVLARRLIDERIKSDEPPDSLFFAKLQRAWRDGDLSVEEQQFCRELSIAYPVYVRMRFAVTPRTGETRFEAVRRRVLELE